MKTLSLLVGLTAAAPAAAETLKAVPARLDPTKAYVLVEYKLQKNPLAGFPGSRKTLPLTSGLFFARYDPVLGDIRGMGKAEANPVPAKQKPMEGFRNRQIVKGSESRLFLLELEPDVWVVQGYGDTSFSLGSYMFKLEPGSVTDLGIVTAEADWAEGESAPTLGDALGAALAGPFGSRPDIAPMRVSFRPRTDADLPLPGTLPLAQVRQPAFTPGVKFGNYLGGLVNRIEGVNFRARAGTAQPASPVAPN